MAQCKNLVFLSHAVLPWMLPAIRTCYSTRQSCFPRGSRGGRRASSLSNLLRTTPNGVPRPPDSDRPLQKKTLSPPSYTYDEGDISLRFVSPNFYTEPYLSRYAIPRTSRRAS